ncbi:hypothetical protein HNQ77_004969 [Silvibacterium bohemicum]|uniref:Antitoxin n=1 Tax=Silvibacterium bohemicum TaxID=1577686 RepID=A0A841K9M3_9BACT|nr:CopG family transcriptional regulator [Silvibacterium bohemicum]MBB6146984.1 hypothetical protein [Silvibacterium bohemicum]
MRTTITLDADVEQLLKKAIRERDISFKEAVNDAIRTGLKAGATKRPRFRQQTFSMGAPQNFQWEKALGMAAALEDEEIMRKMAMGK